ncbi:uncharacterized protein LOC106773029 isoform X1 [Vigna radiata var. radiata]|uniref:Uncharacterized protein LOC106773029 isoform X1 n=1 Tax=Vigna radiata var. radiata TaxID=3916 RepID=A0A1S3VA09_VIGRR|nr:uncharacterized protein LOC106773029 isoform X1 [Vigna radiata var. radiata]
MCYFKFSTSTRRIHISSFLKSRKMVSFSQTVGEQKDNDCKYGENGVNYLSVPCRIGICKTPMEVTSSQLIASEVFPRSIVKILFYPGAVAKAICNQKTIPSYKNLLNIHQFNTRAMSAASDIQHLEVLAGSYLSVGGAITGLIKPGRMGLFGVLLLMWGVIRESIMGTSGFAQTKGIHIYPAMYIVLISAFFSIRKDVRKLIRTFTRKHVVKVKRFKSKGK